MTWPEALFYSVATLCGAATFLFFVALVANSRAQSSAAASLEAIGKNHEIAMKAANAPIWSSGGLPDLSKGISVDNGSGKKKAH